MTSIYSIYFHVKYTNLTKFNMCKSFTSFFLYLTFPLLPPLIFYFLSPYQSEHYTKKLQVFDLILSYTRV